MTITKQDFVDILDVLNTMFDNIIKGKVNKEDIIIENVKLSKMSSHLYKDIYIKNGTKKDYKIKVFVNDEEKYTLYFYRGRYKQKYCFKKMDKEIVTKEVLDCYRLLSNFKFIKLHNF